MPAARLRDAQIVASLKRRLGGADASTLTNFAWFAARRGERQAALDAARGAIAMPDAPQAAWHTLFLLGRSLIQTSHLSEALAVFDQMLVHQPAHAGALFHRGVVLAKLHRYDEALENWEVVGRMHASTEIGVASRRHAESARQLASLFEGN